MSQQLINIGAAPNDGTGDTLRAGADKINDNFTELYARGSVTTQAGTSYTAGLADAENYIRFTAATAVTFTVPNDSTVNFPLYTIVSYEQAGTGVVTVAGAAGVTVNSRGGFIATAGQYAVAQIKKVAANTWTVIGDVA